MERLVKIDEYCPCVDVIKNSKKYNITFGCRKTENSLNRLRRSGFSFLKISDVKPEKSRTLLMKRVKEVVAGGFKYTIYKSKFGLHKLCNLGIREAFNKKIPEKIYIVLPSKLMAEKIKNKFNKAYY